MITEREQALNIAARILTTDTNDPNSDIAILARQLERAQAEINKLTMVALAKRMP